MVEPFILFKMLIIGYMITFLAPNLKVIGTMSVGYNHIDIEACRARYIKKFVYLLETSCCEMKEARRTSVAECRDVF